MNGCAKEFACYNKNSSDVLPLASKHTKKHSLYNTLLLVDLYSYNTTLVLNNLMCSVTFKFVVLPVPHK